jgi:hypothetical protein
MKPEIVEVVNFRAFGEKVKAWARGTEPLPQTIDAFAAQLAAADIGVTIPDSIKHVRFVQDDAETLVVKLPCRELLEQGEAAIANSGGDYPLPSFYERTFAAKPHVKDKQAFHAERIGDYAIATCM